jgi:hypothetical protein
MKKKACVTNLLETLDFLTKCHWLKIPVVIAFIDFLKAFDLVSHKRLLFKLSCYGINGSLLAWIASFLEDRTQRVVMGNVISSWEKVTSGVPQGSVLGPILFIIFINEISELLISLNELYADDTKLMREIKSDSDVSILQGDIDKIVEWTRKWLMKLNENKCKVMYIGGGNEKNIFTIESYDGSIRTNLIETTLERDLGIMISADLKWRQHVMHCANKANKILGMLSRTFEYRDLELIKSLYTTFVRPHLEFAVAVWSPYLKGDIDVLERVQRRATKLVPSLKKLDYKKRLEAMGLTELELRRERGDLIQLYKLFHDIDNVIWPATTNLTVNMEPVVSRRHGVQLTKELVKHSAPRYNFFSNRVVNNWNNLPSDVAYAPTLNSFKAQIDDLKYKQN